MYVCIFLGLKRILNIPLRLGAESADFAHFSNFLLEELDSGRFCRILADFSNVLCEKLAKISVILADLTESASSESALSAV